MEEARTKSDRKTLLDLCRSSVISIGAVEEEELRSALADMVGSSAQCCATSGSPSNSGWRSDINTLTPLSSGCVDRSCGDTTCHSNVHFVRSLSAPLIHCQQKQYSSDVQPCKPTHALPKNVSNESFSTDAMKRSYNSAMRNAPVCKFQKSAAAPSTSTNASLDSKTELTPLPQKDMRIQEIPMPDDAGSDSVGEMLEKASVALEEFSDSSKNSDGEITKVLTRRSHSTSQPRPRSQGHLRLSDYRKAKEPGIRLTAADPQKVIHDTYDLHLSPVLGHGASSTVSLAVRKCDHKFVAVKSIPKYEILFSRRGHGSRRHRRLDEADILASLEGVPNIVDLLDIYEDEDEVQLVLEYCPGGELFDAIHRKRQDMKRNRATTPCRGSGYSEQQAAIIVAQLLEALRSLHAKGIAHRDVKPENVLLMSTHDDETCVKLSDFGLAKYLHRHTSSASSDSDSDSSGGISPVTPPHTLRARAYSTVGSDYYAAPEVEMGAGYGTQCDMYSLGVTLYILLCGFPPSHRRGCLAAFDPIIDFSSSSGESSDEDEAASNKRQIEFLGSHWKTVSLQAKDLVEKMLHNDPCVRITADQALEHKWIVQNIMANAKNTRDRKVEENCKVQAASPPKHRALKRSSLCFESTESDGKRRSRRRLSPDLSLSAPSAAPLDVLADLYSAVSSVADAATAAAAGFNEGGDILKNSSSSERASTMIKSS